MLDRLQDPNFVEGLAYGTAFGFVLGAVLMAMFLFHCETQDLKRQQHEAQRRRKARQASQAAANWPGAANDDPAASTGSHSPRAQHRSGVR